MSLPATRPAAASGSAGLHTLLQGTHLWRGHELAAVAVPSVPTGHTALDALLPGGGWPRAALTELLCARPGVGELSLLMPALARLAREENRWIVLVGPPYLPYAPAFALAGVDLARLVVVNPRQSDDALWAMEQALGSGACSAVAGWPNRVSERALRRLQLAAENGRAAGFHYTSGAATSSSLAALRLQVEPADTGLRLRLLKVRGGGVGTTLTLAA